MLVIQKYALQKLSHNPKFEGAKLTFWTFETKETFSTDNKKGSLTGANEEFLLLLIFAYFNILNLPKIGIGFVLPCAALTIPMIANTRKPIHTNQLIRLHNVNNPNDHE